MVRPLVPGGLALDVADEAAWVSLVTFRIPAMRAALLPPIPGLRSGAECHLCTYVIDPEGRRGTWLLSLDIVAWGTQPAIGSTVDPRATP